VLTVTHKYIAGGPRVKRAGICHCHAWKHVTVAATCVATLGLPACLPACLLTAE